MKKSRFKITIATLAFVVLGFANAFAQNDQSSAPQTSSDVSGKISVEAGGTVQTIAVAAPTARIVITPATLPMDLARAAYAAQGGDKYRDLKSMVMTGSVDLYAPNSLQFITGKFAIVTAGERSRTELQSPVFNLRQISDGTRTYSSIAQMQMPPPTKFGISVLMKYDQPGYVVTALPDNKKLRAFRITDPDGNTTDFFISPVNARVMTFTIPYRGLTFGVDFKSFKEIDGVLVPSSFTERLEMREGAAFADFKVKDVKLNQEIADDMFEIPAQ